MSYLGNLMAEQEADDYLMSLGDGERRELMEDLENKTKRKVGRPRKSEEEKKANRVKYQKEYWQKWRANLNEEQENKRREQTRKSHDKWVSSHKDEWNAYMREYRKRKKAELDKSKKV